MADGVTVDNGALTDYVASTDEGAGGHVQRVKLAYSADGSEVHVPADADGLLVNLGANNDVTVSGVSTAANQATIITHVDGIETVLGTIDTDTGSIATSASTLAGAVSGTEMQVDVLTMPTVTVTGTVTANAGSGTLAVSAASLPLPSGASTAAKQPALGTAGTASTDVITVQGIASGTVIPVSDGGGALTVDGTVAATQSGTWTVQPGNTANTTAWKVDGSAVTQPVSGTVTADLGATDNAVLDAIAASVAGTLTVGSHAVTNAGTFAVQAAGDVAHHAPDSGNPVKVGGVYRSTYPTLDDGDRGDWPTTPSGIPIVALAGSTSSPSVVSTAAGDNADAVTVSTGANRLLTLSRGTIFNGTTWDRMRGDTTNGLDVDVTRSALPSGASTSALQTSSEALLTTIDADTGGILTAVQLIDNAISGSEMQVDVVAALPAGTNNIGDVDVLSVVPGTGATALGKAIDTAAGSTDTGVAALFVRDDALTTLTPVDGDYVPGRVDSTGALHVAVASGSVTASGTITAELSATDNAVLDDIAAKLAPVTPGTRVSLIDVDETEDEIKATAGTLYSLVVTNLATSTRYVRMYNATAASTTVGTTTPWRGPYAIPAGAGIVYVFERGLTFGTALCIAATTGVADSDTGAPGANEIVAEVVYV